jgi:hypothetical protein
MAARCANQAPRRVCLQPAFALTAVPDAVFGTEHPTTPFAVQDREVAHREPKGSGLQATVATLVDQQAITSLGVGKRIDSHAQSIAGLSTSWGGYLPRLRRGDPSGRVTVGRGRALLDGSGQKGARIGRV